MLLLPSLSSSSLSSSSSYDGDDDDDDVRKDSAKSAGYLKGQNDGMEYPRPQAVTRYSVTFPALCSERLVIIIIIIIIIILILTIINYSGLIDCKRESCSKKTPNFSNSRHFQHKLFTVSTGYNRLTLPAS